MSGKIIAEVEEFYKTKVFPKLEQKSNTLHLPILKDVTYLGSIDGDELLKMGFVQNTGTQLYNTGQINFFKAYNFRGVKCFGFEFEENPRSGGYLEVDDSSWDKLIKI